MNASELTAETFVRSICGGGFDVLIRHMRDAGSRSLGLSATRAGTLVGDAYRDCFEKVRSELHSSTPAQLAAIHAAMSGDLAEVTDVTERDNFVHDLLEDATRGPYYAIEDSAFDACEPTAPTYVAHPALLESTDRDGLLRLAGFDAKPKVLFHGSSAIHYHPFLRRNFAESINDTLTFSLLELDQLERVSARIAVNEHNFMPASEWSDYIEADHWHGAPLTDDRIDDPYSVGSTVHAEPADTGFLGRDYPQLIVSWTYDHDEGTKTVQIEEFSNRHDQGGFRLLRYLHAIRDIEIGEFIHCDGAVRAYSQEQYADRVKRPYMTGRPSSSKYRKVFRVDGHITTDEWSELAARWFRGNRLILEYLNKPGNLVPS